MIRKKVKLAYITNDSSRKGNYRKRKKGLMRKMSELSTLCGIGACAIIYSPYESQPEDIMQLDVKNMDPMKRQQWIMELMNNNNNNNNNPQTHVGGDEMMFQFDDNINPNNGH
ncbi:hypothetical protein Golax_025374 [Gossypium laxum]|uniref:MADS-box domain-containing protein n=1 Tax=Gossypium laxum TaxID=34288 RepID=A0A7J9AYK7_9ROSI|nr:hypothetical protein [Gossypium laxum]